MATGKERALGWPRSRFERHIAGKRPDEIDLGLLQELVEELASLDAPELDERRKLLDEVRHAQDPATASPDLWWGHLANRQYDTHRFLLSRLRRPFASINPALYERVIGRLTEILAAMRLRPLTTPQQQNISSVEARLAAYGRELDELRRAREGLDATALTEALAERVGFLERSWSYLAKIRPPFADRMEHDGLLDGLDECRRQLEALPPSELLDRVRDLEDAWVATCERIMAAQKFEPDTTLPTPGTKKKKLELHTDTARDRAIAGLLSEREKRDRTAIRMVSRGQLVLLQGAILVFAIAGPRNVHSHFAERHRFRLLAWRDKTWDYRHELRAEMGRAGGPRPIHLFVRGPDEKTYFYAGRATIIESRENAPRKGVWVDLALQHEISSPTWRRFGGSRRIVSTLPHDHPFPGPPETFTHWIHNNHLGHADLVSEDGPRLTLHGGGPRVELEYRARHDGEPLYGRDDAASSESPVDIGCSCGRTVQLDARDTVTREAATLAMKAFMDTGEPLFVQRRAP